MKYLSILALLLIVISCSSQERDELKKSFAEKVAEKVKDASVHSLGCKTGDAVEEDVRLEVERFLKIQKQSEGQKSVLLTQLCQQGVTIAFPYLVDLGTGKLPESWQADGCSLKSVGEDIEELAEKLCSEIK